MQNKFKNLVKATIMDIIVALLITISLISSVYIFLGQEINTVLGYVNTVTIATPNESNVTTIINDESNTLQNYPEYGTKYGTIEISKISVNLPVYFGSTLEVLKKGVGHDSGSYFPGEGGSIVYMGHNSKKVFRRFSELKEGDEIKVTTGYGTYIYKIYDMKVIKETDLEALPIQKDKEILMVYTCYPFNNIGYADHRYVVYSELISHE